MRKQIIWKSDEIDIKNYYKIDNLTEEETSWEDIESFYKLKEFNNSYFICPKGSHYLTEYTDKNLYIKNPFNITGNWELLCFRQFVNFHNMFTFYLNSNLTKIYYYNWNNFIEGVDIKRNLFDLIWTRVPTNTNDFPMFAITFKDNKIYISKLIFYINENNVSYEDIEHIELNDNLLHSEGYFLYNIGNKFCWITYNKSTLISGYSENEVENGVNGNIKDYILKKNTESPFKFLDDITIESVKFIRGTKYIIYNIITNSNNKNYIGVIDIEFNKIIYNVENIFKDIKPYSIKGLILETDTTVYKVCFSGKDENNECNSECPSGQILVLNNINSNYCVDKNSSDYYILKPDNIEIANCDENLYVIQNQNECGLCKDLNIDKPFKIINVKECLDTKPENTYYINEQLKILNYCHESCKSCNGENENDCISCDIGYYKENNACKKCHESCLTCEKNGSDENPNCQSCQENKYLTDDNLKCVDFCENNYYENLDEKKCYKCHQNCETCSGKSFDNNNNCLSCDQNSKFKYLLITDSISNCVEECPKSTILDINLNQCLEKTNKSKNNNDKMTIYILILIATLIIILIIIYIIYIYFKKKRNPSDSQINNKIKIELKKNSTLIEK